MEAASQMLQFYRAEKVTNQGKFKIHWWAPQRGDYSRKGSYLTAFLALGLVEASDKLIESKVLSLRTHSDPEVDKEWLLMSPKLMQ